MVLQVDAYQATEYQFYPTNHSVIRAEYGYPCIPYEDTGVDKIGFISGFSKCLHCSILLVQRYPVDTLAVVCFTAIFRSIWKTTCCRNFSLHRWHFP